jgi:hypothetical protein
MQAVKIPGSHSRKPGGRSLGRHYSSLFIFKVAEDGTAQVAHTKKGANTKLHVKE